MANPSLTDARDLRVIAHEWLTHEGFYRYADRHHSTEEVHAMATAYLRLKDENARPREKLARVGFEADAAREQRDDELVQADALGFGLRDQGGVE